MVPSGDGTAPSVEDVVDVHDDAEESPAGQHRTVGAVSLAAAALVALSAYAAIAAGRTLLGVALVTVVALLAVAGATAVLVR